MPRPLLPFAIAAALAAQVRADDGAFFTAQVEPILKERCYECHSHKAGKIKGGLALDSRGGWEQGGNSGVDYRSGESADVAQHRESRVALALWPRDRGDAE